MDMHKSSGNAESRFSTLLATAAKLPGVRIDRDAYLRTALRRHCSEEDIRRATEETPAAAGIPLDVLERVANESIRYETAKVSAVSAATGLPGLLALPATVPADLAQYVGHMLRVAQKLAYLYSWPDLFSGEDDLDDATSSVLTLFFGVMFGTQSANAAVGKVAASMAEQVAKKLPQKALTQGVVYPVVKKVAGYLGVEMTKQTFAKSVSKAIPVVGAAVSGGLTFATFLPMAKRLRKHLSGLEIAVPTGQVLVGEVVRDEEPPAADEAKIPKQGRDWRIGRRKKEIEG
nr:EcsC family protein [Streptomyces sp. SHP 1-2]